MSEANKQIRNLEVLIRSRYPIIYVVSSEEKRVVESVGAIGQRLGKKIYHWSCLSGLVPLAPVGTPQQGQSQKKAINSSSRDPVAALKEAMDFKEPALFIFKDFHPYMCKNNATVLRSLREVAQEFTNSFKSIILIGPTLNLPQDLEKDISVVDFPLPGSEEIGSLLDKAAREISSNPKLSIDLSGDAREDIIKAAHGLTINEIENVFAKSLVVNGRLGQGQIPDILSEKRQIIRKSGLLDYYESDVALEDVGGLDNLKNWLVKRKLAFSDRAMEFGLPAPRGVLMLGVQGCGKSMCAKAVSALWGLPLLRLDVGRIFDSLVGGSEENIRRAISISEGVSPCILWVDEIDKAFGGLGGSSGDSGTSQRVLGSFLTWLAEKTSAVFVVATANNVSALPPELLRKGRFDEIFFIDLPNTLERLNIINIHLRRRRRNPANYDLAALAQAMDGFSGAEIEQAVVSGLFDAFYDNGRDVTSQDILIAAGETVPLSQTMLEEIEALRRWCRSRTRPASTIDQSPVRTSRLANLPYGGLDL